MVPTVFTHFSNTSGVYPDQMSTCTHRSTPLALGLDGLRCRNDRATTSSCQILNPWPAAMQAAACSARRGQAGPRGPQARPVAARAGAPAAARELVAGVAREHRDEVAAVVERARRAADQWEVRL